MISPLPLAILLDMNLYFHYYTFTVPVMFVNVHGCTLKAGDNLFLFCSQIKPLLPSQLIKKKTFKSEAEKKKVCCFLVCSFLPQNTT